MCGVLIFIGLAVYEARLAVACVLGSMCGVFTALAMQADPTAVKDGIWGFNPALTACAVCTFCRPTKSMWALLVFSSVATQVLAAGMGRTCAEVFKIPSGTLPFCITATFVHRLIGNVSGISPKPGRRQSIQAAVVSLFGVSVQSAEPNDDGSGSPDDYFPDVNGSTVVLGTPLSTPTKMYITAQGAEETNESRSADDV